MGQGVRLPAGAEERNKRMQQQAKDIMPDWLEKALDLVGMGPNTPIEDQIAGGLTPNPVGAVSLFMKKGMGGKAMREKFGASTLAALEETISALGIGPEQAEKMRSLVKKYPRVSAHTNITNIPDNPTGVANFDPISGGNQVGPGFGRIGITPRGAKIDPAHSLAHEMGHAAQNISLKESFQPLYNDAERMLGGGERGYFTNPFERSARQIADRKVPAGTPPQVIWEQVSELLGGSKRPPGFNAMTELRKLGIIDPQMVPEGKFHETVRKRR